MTELTQVIFAVDNGNDVHGLAKFLRYIDAVRAMNNLRSKPVLCIGMYKGKIEPSIMLSYPDFEDYVLDSGFVDEQESFLFVPGDVRQPCTLRDRDEDIIEVLGPMREVNFSDPNDYIGWTHVLETGKYFTCDKVGEGDLMDEYSTSLEYEHHYYDSYEIEDSYEDPDAVQQDSYSSY